MRHVHESARGRLVMSFSAATSTLLPTKMFENMERLRHSCGIFEHLLSGESETGIRYSIDIIESMYFRCSNITKMGFSYSEV